MERGHHWLPLKVEPCCEIIKPLIIFSSAEMAALAKYPYSSRALLGDTDL